jgi:hypothetical protein
MNNGFRQGIRGVTIPDVQAVGANGSSAMRGGYTFTRGNRPLATRTPSLDVQNLIKGMTSIPFNTAGEKYGGYGTAAQLETAVLGSIDPFYAIGDYASRLAAEENQRLLDEAASQLRFGQGTAASRSLGNIRQALSGDTAESRGVASAQDALAQVLAENAMYERGRSAIRTAGQTSDKPEFFAPSVRGESTEGQREEARMARAAMPEESGLMARTAREMLARKALRDAAYADAMARRNAVAFAGTAPVDVLDPVTGEYKTIVATAPNLPVQSMRDVAVSQATPGVLGAYETGVAQNVQPSLDLAAEISGTPRYELARQMATQYFGMDPALAAGTFTPQMDVDYIETQQAYKAAQDLAAGIDPTASVEDILLREDPSGRRLAEFQQMQAEEAERKLYEGARTAAEEEMDANIQVATGYSVEQAAGSDLALSTARGRLSDPTFLATVDKAVDSLASENAETEADRKVIAQNYARQFLEQQADPIGAQILLNILMGYTFNIQPTFGM